MNDKLEGINVAGRYSLKSQLLFTTLHSYPDLRPPYLSCMQVQYPEFLYIIQPHSTAQKSNCTSAIAKDDIGTPICAKFAEGTHKIRMHLFDSSQ